MKKQSIIQRGGAIALAVFTTAFCLLVSQPLQAGIQVQTDTNSLAVASTNTFVLLGDNTGSYTNGETPAGSLFVDGSRTTDMPCAVGGFFTNSTANSSNVIFRIASTVDIANWTNNAQVITLVVPGATTNWVNYQFKITNPYPGYGLRAVENANAAGITARSSSLYFKGFSKTGE